MERTNAVISSPARKRKATIAIAYREGHYRVMASKAFAVGARILTISGRTTTEPNRWTLQIDRDVHIEADPSAAFEEQVERFPWRFLNHGCEPNTKIDGLDVIAIAPIRAGDELTFNYNSTELDMASPFACHCESVDCQGTISGFQHLNAAERERLRPILAAHLQ